MADRWLLSRQCPCVGKGLATGPFKDGSDLAARNVFRVELPVKEEFGVGKTSSSRARPEVVYVGSCFSEDGINHIRGVAASQEMVSKVQGHLGVVRGMGVLFPVALKVTKNEAL